MAMYPRASGQTTSQGDLEAISSGRIYVPMSLADVSGERAPEGLQIVQRESDDGSFAWDGLTPRQRDALGLVVQGSSNKEIARALNLGEGTVKVHVAALFRVLGVTSRSAVGGRICATAPQISRVRRRLGRRERLGVAQDGRFTCSNSPHVCSP
jgi:DNA-binding NarL/FixJ family response regulator